MFNNSVSTFESILRNKEVVVDTSSLLLAGVQLLNSVPSCKIVIPAVVVKELEANRSNSTVGFLAREWLRLLESLRVEYGKQLSERVPVPNYKGVFLSVEPNHSNQESLPKHLRDGSHDSTILSVAMNLKKELEAEGKEDVIVLLSNDSPMRLYATLDLGIPAFEFSSSQILEVEPFNGRYNIDIPQEEYINTDKVQDATHVLPFETVVSNNLPDDIAKNAIITARVAGDRKIIENFIYSNGGLTALGYKKKIYGLTAQSVEQSAAISYLTEPAETLPIVSLGGSAGTGKTLISVAAGLDAVKRGEYRKMVVFRSLHEMGQGQEVGFLPGTLEEKMEVWAGAVYDSLDYIAGNQKGNSENAAKELKKMIEVSPITYLRGRSLSNCYIILEEAQNFSRSELLHILTRTGMGTKMVLTFDANQVDNRFLQSGNKADIWTVIDSLRKESILAHVTLTKIERSKVAEVTSRLLEN